MILAGPAYTRNVKLTAFYIVLKFLERRPALCVDNTTSHRSAKHHRCQRQIYNTRAEAEIALKTLWGPPPALAIKKRPLPSTPLSRNATAPPSGNLKTPLCDPIVALSARLPFGPSLCLWYRAPRPLSSHTPLQFDCRPCGIAPSDCAAGRQFLPLDVCAASAAAA